MNKKGFTLVELIAVVAIIGILALISIPTVSTLLKGFRDNYYEKLKKSIVSAAREYASDIKSKNGKVTVRDLISNSYIDEVKDYKKQDCDKDSSSVYFNKETNTYTVFLNCPLDNYSN